MIDIHSHVLYGLDDGAGTLEDSLAMIRMAAASGTTDLVATPHANLEYKFDPEKIRERLSEISGEGVRVYSGCDFHLSYENIQDAIENPAKYAINHKCYLLVEFSDLIIFRNTSEIFARLQDAGMIPVVTHPERNGLLRQRVEEIARWVEDGARVQVTAQSFLGHFGRRAREFSEILLDRGLVHFIASDAHDCEHRPPKLDQAFQWIEKRHSQEVAERLCVTNPRAAIEGVAFTPTAPPQRSEAKKWYQLWR
ncbi:MAG TPA: CpsB/CapC family capsule biosynthesis tyrosine phosphatase [Bryobacteraceae bacterium]|nr:CpsB/CapC family capsule biosynthesis tyrosine phosphatase [Bryobacteraceae bacterium]